MEKCSVIFCEKLSKLQTELETLKKDYVSALNACKAKDKANETLDSIVTSKSCKIYDLEKVVHNLKEERKKLNETIAELHHEIFKQAEKIEDLEKEANAHKLNHELFVEECNKLREELVGLRDDYTTERKKNDTLVNMVNSRNDEIINLQVKLKESKEKYSKQWVESLDDATKLYKLRKENEEASKTISNLNTALENTNKLLDDIKETVEYRETENKMLRGVSDDLASRMAEIVHIAGPYVDRDILMSIIDEVDDVEAIDVDEDGDEEDI